MDDGIDRTVHFGRLRDVVPDELKPLIACEVSDVLRRSGQKIVDPHNRVAFSQQAVAHMRADEARSSGDHDAQNSKAPMVISIVTDQLHAAH